jgi:oxygen-dependent protoporphyrinogen oxidase
VKSVLIVGGGISGLTVAYTLLDGSNLDVTVLEADSRAGGKIWSERINGFLCEKGPNGFLDNKPKTLELCDKLGLTPVRANDNARKRYLLTDNILKPLPESPPAFFKSDILSLSGRLRILYEPFAPKGPDDETVAEFIKRRLGREVLEMLIDPMVSGIFAGDPYRLSMKSCFPRIKEFEQEYGSLIRAFISIRRQKKTRGEGDVSVAPGGRLTSFLTGVQSITDMLAQRLGDHLKTGVMVEGIERRGEVYHLYTSKGVFDADMAVLACPAYESARILKGFDDLIANDLSAIPYPPVVVVCLGYERDKVGHPLDGFGFLIPHKERRRILGTLWDSSIFPERAPEGYVLLRTMLGGARSSEIAMFDDDKIINTVIDELRFVLKLRTGPDMVRLYRWERAIPQYEIGHQERLSRIEERLKSYAGLYLTGNAYRGIGMNDCIENGIRIAEEILQHINYH